MRLPISDEGYIAAVVAHPDDETFGLGALLANLILDGREVRVLCFTHGEASTIGAGAGLGETRQRELFAAASILGVAQVELLDLPDGSLNSFPDSEIDSRIEHWLEPDVAALVTFEPQGVTGHPDHQVVSRAVGRVADRRGLPVVEWGVDPGVAAQLAARHGLHFESIDDGVDVYDVGVDRAVQLIAIDVHASQLDEERVVCKMLALEGNVERVRVRRPSEAGEGPGRAPLPGG